MAEFIIAITGGIGSGKSAVANQFELLGITVVDLDDASRAIVAPGMPALHEIAKHFGDTVLTSSGELDRRTLRELVFKVPEDRQWLEKLTHPLINEWAAKQLLHASSKYAIVVNPLLRVRGGYVNRILVVDVPVEVQIRRTVERDQVSKEQAESIVSAQINRVDRLQLADDIIANSGTIDELAPKVKSLHREYLELTNE